MLEAVGRASSRRSVPPAPELQLGIDGPEEITLQLAGEEGQAPAALILSGPRPVSALPAYSMALLDVLEGRNALSVSGEEAEEAWRVVTPVLEAWDERGWIRGGLGTLHRRPFACLVAG